MKNKISAVKHAPVLFVQSVYLVGKTSASVYDGDKPWTASTDFYTEFGENEDLARASGFAKYDVLELRNLSDEKIKQYKWAGYALSALKNRYLKDAVQYFKGIVEYHLQLELSGEEECATILLNYCMAVRPDITDEVIEQVKKEFEQENNEEAVMQVEPIKKSVFQKGVDSGYQRGIDEGVNRGITQGITKGISKGENLATKAIAKNMLSRNMPADTISELTGLSVGEVNALLEGV